MTIGISGLLFAGALAAVASAMVLAAWSDLRSFTIPNRFCGIIVAAYPFALVGMPVSAWSSGLVTGVIVLLIGAILFAQRWVGGGDVKLASAAALWAGPALLDEFMTIISIVGGLLAAAMLFTPLPRLLRIGQAPVEGFSQPMPFGVPIAAGGLWVVALQFASFQQGHV